jgi:hypothetical protein
MPPSRGYFLKDVPFIIGQVTKYSYGINLAYYQCLKIISFRTSVVKIKNSMENLVGNFVLSQRGGQMLVINEFKFKKRQVLKDGFVLWMDVKQTAIYEVSFQFMY